MLKVGITGGIGAGKSIISKIFQTLGVPVYDADSRAKLLMNSNPDLKKRIIEAFGDRSFSADGLLDRGFLSATVFNDEEKLKALNKLVHPAVKLDFECWSNSAKSPYIIKEAALLIETQSYKELDMLILVTAPEKIRIKRVLMRDEHRSKVQVEAIIKNQLPEIEKKKIADILINNDESHPILLQVLEIHTLLTQKAVNFQ